MFNLTANTWLLLLFTVVPGFIANRVYALRCPTARQDWEKIILEPITCSVVNLMLWFWLVIPILRTPFESVDEVRLAWVSILVCLLSPTALALFWYWLRVRILPKRLGMDHPTPRGWDYFVNGCRHFFVLFHLKTGKMVGGYFGAKSYASTYPQEPELYVEQVWRIDQTTGAFVEMVDGTLGAVIRQSEWERVEFLEVRTEGQEHDGTEQEHRKSGSDGDCAGGVRGGCQEGTRGTEQPGNGKPTEDCSPAGRVGDSTAAGEQQAKEVGANHAAGV